MCDSTISPEYMLNPSSSLVASCTGFFPAITDFAGDLDFQIILNESDATKKKWLVLYKLYYKTYFVFNYKSTSNTSCCIYITRSLKQMYTVFREAEQSVH